MNKYTYNYFRQQDRNKAVRQFIINFLIIMAVLAFIVITTGKGNL